jgi:hypothetical protein
METEMDKNTFFLDYRENPDLLAALGGKEVGEECEITLKLSFLSNDTDEGANTTINSIVVKGDYDDDGEDIRAIPSESEPVMAVMMGRADVEEGEV